jgi:hypothetical protein
MRFLVTPTFERAVKLLMVGPHENFYRDLKRTEL